MRATATQMQAINYAKGGQLPLLLFDGISSSTDEAELKQDDFNFERAGEDALREARRY